MAELIDDTNKFNNLKTNIKNREKLTKNEQQHYNRWISILNKEHSRVINNPDDITWLKDDYKTVYNIILGKYTNNSLKSHLTSLAGILLKIDKEHFKNTARSIIIQYKTLSKKIDDYSKKQIISKSEKDNFIEHETLLKALDNLLQEWAVDRDNKNLHFKALIIGLYTLIAPLRDNWRHMEYIVSNNKPISDTTNYLWRKGHTYTILINKDKVSNKIGKAEIPIKTTDITKHYMKVNKLTIILNESFNIFPRKYVLSNIDGDKPMNKSQFGSLMYQVFNKHVYPNIFRKSYIAHYYDTKKKISNEIISDIAKKMRHNEMTARLKYFKPNLKSKHKAVSTRNKTYYEKNKEKIKRNKLIRMLNNGCVKSRQSTLDKYDIKLLNGVYS